MNSKTITKIVLAVIIIGGAWLLLSGSGGPLTALQPITKSSLSATATLVPAQPVAGQSTTLTFTFTDASGNPVADLMEHHGRRVHVVIVSKDLETLGHIHPIDFTADLTSEINSGVYSVNYSFPEAGEYIVAVDVMNSSDELSKQFLVNVIGTPKMAATASSDMSHSKCFTGHLEDGVDRYVESVDMKEAEVPCPAGYEVTLAPASKTIIAGQDVLLRFHVEKDGMPVANLSPYLDAALHLAIIPTSFDFVLHRHGSVDASMKSSEMTGMDMVDSMSMGVESTEAMKEMDSMEGMQHNVVPMSFGPNLISEPIIFPKAGVYRVFAQIKHEGEIIVASFLVTVEG